MGFLNNSDTLPVSLTWAVDLNLKRINRLFL